MIIAAAPLRAADPTPERAIKLAAKSGGQKARARRGTATPNFSGEWNWCRAGRCIPHIITHDPKTGKFMVRRKGHPPMIVGTASQRAITAKMRWRMGRKGKRCPDFWTEVRGKASADFNEISIRYRGITWAGKDPCELAEGDWAPLLSVFRRKGAKARKPGPSAKGDDDPRFGARGIDLSPYPEGQRLEGISERDASFIRARVWSLRGERSELLDELAECNNYRDRIQYLITRYAEAEDQRIVAAMARRQGFGTVGRVQLADSKMRSLEAIINYHIDRYEQSVGTRVAEQLRSVIQEWKTERTRRALEELRRQQRSRPKRQGGGK